MPNETDETVRADSDPFSPAVEARVCELVLGDRRHGITPPDAPVSPS